MKFYVHYGEKELGFSFPQGWDVISAEDRPPISGVADPIKEIRDVLDHPIGSPRIEVLGEPLDENYLTNLGISVSKTEKKFNDAAGFTKKDDRLPRFFLEEKRLRVEMFWMSQKRR
jgi:hypothetical protein